MGDTFQDMKALLEANRLEMKTFMTDMNNQFNTFVKGVHGDKGIQGSPNHNQGTQAGRMIEGGTSGGATMRNHYTVAVPKLEFLQFNVNNPREWEGFAL